MCPPAAIQNILWWTYGQPQASIAPVKPINQPLSGLTVDFNRPITGFNSLICRSCLAASRYARHHACDRHRQWRMTYTLGNLTSLTLSSQGNYTLTVNAAGVADAGGNGLAGNLPPPAPKQVRR